MRRTGHWLLPLSWLLCCGMEGVEYPQTPKQPVLEVIHGVSLVDDYRWLENPQDPEVIAWIEAQDKLTEGILQKLPQRRWLTERFNKLWRYDDETTPLNVLEGDRLFFYTKAATDEKWVYKTKQSKNARTVTLLNPNEWDAKVTLDYVLPSRDGKYIAFGKSEQGDENTRAQIMEVKTKKLLPDKLRGSRQGVICWLPNNKGFYYHANPLKREVPDGEEFYWQAMYYHELGTPASQDVKIMSHDGVKEYFHSVYLTEDARYRLYYRSYQSNNELAIQAVDSAGPPIPVVEGFTATYSAVVLGDTMFIVTNENAPKYKVYVTEASKPQRSNWREFLPESKDKLAFFDGIDGRIYTIYEHNAYSQVKIYALDGTFLRELALPDMGTASISGYWSRPEVRVYFSSYTHPDEDFSYDFKRDKLILNRKSPLQVNTTNMETEQVWFKSKDGTAVSMFLLRRKDLPKTSAQPALLTGYGGFNYSMVPSFSTIYYVWLEAGGMVAIPNLRGGGEYGEDWYKSGKLDKKQNVFDDFIAAAEWLISEGYTAPDKLAIEGSSNGGLLMGAVVTQRPDLFKAVLCGHPLLDMIRYHKFTFANIWAGEYGTADDPEQFNYLLDYSPYHNVTYGRVYPAMLINAGEQDIRTPIFHAAKMTARLQEANGDGPPILFLLEKASGHLGSSTTTVAVELYAKLWAFLMDQVELTPSMTTAEMKAKSN